MSRLSWSAVVVIALALAADLSVIYSFGSPWRAILVFTFLLIGPGLPFVRLLRIRRTSMEITLAIALSLGIDTLVAEGMVLAQVWSAGSALAVLIFVAVAGAVALMFTSGQGERSEFVE
jgi:uncharacterized membrane protein